MFFLLFLLLSFSTDCLADSYWDTFSWDIDAWVPDTHGDNIPDSVEDAGCTDSLDADTDDAVVRLGIQTR